MGWGHLAIYVDEAENMELADLPILACLWKHISVLSLECNLSVLYSVRKPSTWRSLDDSTLISQDGDLSSVFLHSL